MRTICLEIQVEKPASAAAENFINMIQNNFGPRAIKISELIQETNQDEVCIRLKQAIKLNRLESNLKKDYNGVFKDLSVTGGGLILKGNRIFIPTSLRDQILKLAHEGHQGTTKTINLLRNRVWFPRIDKLVCEYLKNCPECAMNLKKNPEPLKMTNCSTKPWTKIAVDFFGPLTDGSEVLVIKDTHSKMVIAQEVKSTSCENVLPVIESTISLLGIPEQIKLRKY